MAKISKNLGIVSAIHIGTTAPTNIYLLWHNISDGFHYYFDTITEGWLKLKAEGGGGGLSATLAIGNTTEGNDIKISTASGDSIVFVNAAQTKSISLFANPVAGNFTQIFQDKSGTIALTSDIINMYNNNGTVGAGRVVTLTNNISFNGGEFRTENGYWQGTSKILYINPNGTTGNLFVGQSSGNNTMTGDYNIGLGYLSLNANTTGNRNVAVGYDALRVNTTGANNTAIGYAAMDNSTTASNCTVFGSNALGGANSGDGNVAIGNNSMLTNTTGAYSVAVGRASLQANTTGYSNVAVGDASLYLNTTGFQNVAIGIESMLANTTGSTNTAVGAYALTTNQVGVDNVAIGRTAMQLCIDPVRNTVVGSGAMYAAGTSDTNSAYGYYAMRNNTSGSNNNAFGAYALITNSTGQQNCAFGDSAIESNTTGSYNVGFGRMSLYSNTTGSRNVGLGYKAGYYGVTENDTLYIHNGLGVTNLAEGKSNSLIYGIFDAATANQYFNINGNTNTPLAHYNYMAASNSADTVGDVRFYATYVATVSSFIIEKCTVANATKGAGTWVNINTFSL